MNPGAREGTVVVAFLLATAARAAGAPLYALVGAFPPEMAALREEFESSPNARFTTTTLHGLTFERGTVEGREVVIFRTGVSLVNAAFELQMGLDAFPVTAVLFAGVAGGVDPSLAVGDVVIPERWAYHSEASYLNEDGKGGYVLPGKEHVPSGGNFGMIFPEPVRVFRDGATSAEPMAYFPVDSALLEAARRAVPGVAPIRKSGRLVTVSVGGTGVSGTVFLDNASYRAWVFQRWHARCADMESTALAQVCWTNGKPLLVIRSLSDLAGAQHGRNPIDRNELRVAQIAAKVLHAVLLQLPK